MPCWGLIPDPASSWLPQRFIAQAPRTLPLRPRQPQMGAWTCLPGPELHRWSGRTTGLEERAFRLWLPPELMRENGPPPAISGGPRRTPGLPEAGGRPWLLPAACAAAPLRAEELGLAWSPRGQRSRNSALCKPRGLPPHEKRLGVYEARREEGARLLLPGVGVRGRCQRRAGESQGRHGSPPLQQAEGRMQPRGNDSTFEEGTGRLKLFKLPG